MEGVAHSVSIDECKRISASGIESVDAFSATQIVLKIENFSKGSGAFSAAGTITGVKYAARAVKIVRRLFR